MADLTNYAAALRKVGNAHDFLKQAISDALSAGVGPETIINYLDGPEIQITNAVLRQSLQREVIVVGEQQSEIEGGKPLFHDDDGLLYDEDQTAVIDADATTVIDDTIVKEIKKK